MPEEIFVLFLCAMLTMTVMTGMVLSHRRKTKELQSGAGKGGSSLTTSELERIMRRAVDEGTEPLRQAVEDLEARLAERASSREPVRALPPAERLDLLAQGEDEDEEVIPTSRIPSRTRTR